MPIKRNVLLVLASGLRADAIGAGKVWPVLTPHLDALCASGLNAVAVTPSPQPAVGRLSLYTGLHPRQHGVFERTNVLPHMPGWIKAFREGGYYCSGIGQVGPIADQLHESCIVADVHELDDQACAYLRHANQMGLKTTVRSMRQKLIESGPFDMTHGVTDDVQDVDGFIASTAIDMIGRLPKDKPWLFIVSLTGPGNHLPAPLPCLESVNQEELPNGFMPINLSEFNLYGRCDYPRTFLQNMTRDRAAMIQQHYLGRVSLIDNSVGLIRDAIDRGGHTKQTWTALTSDSGCALGEQGLFGAVTMLCGSTYVPLCVTPPEMDDRYDADCPPMGDEMISTVDLVPTLCGIGQVDVPRGCMGVSLLPGLGGESIGRPSVISEFDNRIMFENLQYKVAFDVETNVPLMMYDMVCDPHERRNLVETIEGANTVDHLRWQLGDALMPMRMVRAGVG